MNKLYSMGKGKIHPAPAAAGGGDVMAVLRLLPAAVLALTAALGAEDREVLAYLVMRSVDGAMAPRPEERLRCRRGGGGGKAAFECGCFECYTGWWSRWDCSPNRELIHQAIEEFEEHLASEERGGGGGRGARRKGKKGREKVKVKAKAPVAAPVEIEVDEAAVAGFGGGEICSGEVEAAGEQQQQQEQEVCDEATVVVEEIDGGEEEEAPAAAADGGGERRGRWSEVVGLLNSRLLNLWGPGV